MIFYKSKRKTKEVHGKISIHEINQSTGGTWLSSQLLVRTVELMNTKFILFSFFPPSAVLTDGSILSSNFSLLGYKLAVAMCLSCSTKIRAWRTEKKKKKNERKKRKKNEENDHWDVTGCPSMLHTRHWLFFVINTCLTLSGFNQATSNNSRFFCWKWMRN